MPAWLYNKCDIQQGTANKQKEGSLKRPRHYKLQNQFF